MSAKQWKNQIQPAHNSGINIFLQLHRIWKNIKTFWSAAQYQTNCDINKLIFIIIKIKLFSNYANHAITGWLDIIYSEQKSMKM